MKTISKEEIKKYLLSNRYYCAYTIDYCGFVPTHLDFHVYVCADGSFAKCENEYTKEFTAYAHWADFLKDVHMEDRSEFVIKRSEDYFEQFIFANNYFKPIIEKLTEDINKFLEQCDFPWAIYIQQNNCPKVFCKVRSSKEGYQRYKTIKKYIEEEDLHTGVMLWCQRDWGLDRVD